MSNISPDKAFDRAVDLVIHADKVTSDWTGRLVTVQTSLVISEGVLLAWKSEQLSFLVVSLVILIAVVGVWSLLLLTNIIVREHEYGHHYEEMVKRAEDSNPFLFGDHLKAVPGLKFACALSILKWVMLVAWILFICVVVWWFSHT